MWWRYILGRQCRGVKGPGAAPANVRWDVVAVTASRLPRRNAAYVTCRRSPMNAHLEEHRSRIAHPRTGA